MNNLDKLSKLHKHIMNIVFESSAGFEFNEPKFGIETIWINGKAAAELLLEMIIEEGAKEND